MTIIKERPIIFSGPMVRAILEGKKTQTRRIVKRSNDMEFDPADPHFGPYWRPYATDAQGEDARVTCPYGEPGDRLWVREAHSLHGTHGQGRSDGKCCSPWEGLPTTISPDGTQIAYYRESFDRSNPATWRPSIHMPRWASRITLEITNIRVERLQQISEADAMAEGVLYAIANSWCAKEAFAALWEHINSPGSWVANPWVWVLEFQRLEVEA